MQKRSSSQDISWFLDLRQHGQLDMDPSYQRRSVWNLKDRRFFLDTIFRGYPCPPIFLHKTLGDGQKTVYAVVDGKQRLQTLFLFADDDIVLASDFGDTRFDGKSWSAIGESEKKLFWDYVIPVEFLSFDPNDTKEVNQAFDRLNRNMRKLDPQELRHARWEGWFISLVENECDDPTWKKLGIVTNARAKRMKDAQFISELLLVLIERKQLGFDQQRLDDAYATYDDPEESDLPISPDEIKDQLAEAKQYLLDMQMANGCIKAYAGTLAVSYTLWAAVVLHRSSLPEAAEFATIFANFREDASAIDSAEDKAGLLAGPHGEDFKLAYEFLQNSKGASTDLGPSTRRLEALLQFLHIYKNKT